MRSSWLPTILLAGVLGLLSLFLALQYTWLTKAGEAERERLQKRVETDSKAFADEFNREIQAAFFNFRIDGNTITAGEAEAFAERFEHWSTRTAYPDLIREIVYLPRETSANALRYDPASRSFAAAADSSFDAVREELAANGNAAFLASDFSLAMRLHSIPNRTEQVVLRRESIPLPTSEIARKMEAPVSGHLIVRLDRDVVVGKMLPQLRERFFNANEFDLSITDSAGNVIFGGNSTAADARAGLFNLKPDSLIFFSEREISLPRSRDVGQTGIDGAGVILDQRIEKHEIAAAAAPGGRKENKFTIQVQESGGPPVKTTIVAAAGPAEPWKLTASHTAGSIDAFVANERRRNLLVGAGLYLLLVLAIGAIVVSAMRSRRFAQRQVDFVSAVSHEFRTPIAVMRSAGENLADGLASEEAQVERYGKLIKGESTKLAAMVEQILEFAGARSGKRSYKFEDVSVASVIGEAIAECRLAADSGQVNILAAVPEGLPPISADRAALGRAICNLVANSIKYGAGDGSVRVNASNGGGRIKITVEDNGIGIDKRDLRRIFEPFYRSREVVDAQIHGNGLGLSLVKDIVEAHHGRVFAESEPGEGSRFTIELPAAQTPDYQ